MTVAGHYLKLLGQKPQRSSGGVISRAVIIPPVEDITLDRAENANRLGLLSQQLERSGMADPQCHVLRAGADLGLRKLVDQGPQAQLGFDEIVALEALVVLEGLRPVIDFVSNRLSVDAALLGEWTDVTKRDADIIEHVARSVGRINCGGAQLGTGFVVSEGLVMTNKHVLEKIARYEDGQWHFAAEVTISFDDFGNDDRDFILSAKGMEIMSDAQTRDYVLVPVQAGAGGRSLPEPLRLEDTRGIVQHSRPVYVLGYPGKPVPGAERFSLLHRLFHCEYGRKRYCPGEISASLGEVQETTDAAVFGHDCSTLGGSSGSPVIDLGDSSAMVVGIHFAGIKRISNFAYSMAALRDDLEDQALNFV